MLSKALIENGKANCKEEFYNSLSIDELNIIDSFMVGCMVTKFFHNQSMLDLGQTRYHVYDWLEWNMEYQEVSIDNNKNTMRILIDAFQKSGYNEHEFIKYLQFKKYEEDKSWIDIVL